MFLGQSACVPEYESNLEQLIEAEKGAMLDLALRHVNCKGS